MKKLRNRRPNQKGFTLVEIAIVLVIIGLLIGGVLKGQAMIQNAKVKRVVKQADEIRAAVMSFFDKYGMFPGDENLANLPPGDPNQGDGDGQIEGAEDEELFEDLALAGYIGGSFDGTNLPNHVFGDNFTIQFIDPPGAGAGADHYIMFYNLPWDVCLEIDTKYDDGAQTTGSIVANEAYAEASGAIAIFYMQF